MQCIIFMQVGMVNKNEGERLRWKVCWLTRCLPVCGLNGLNVQLADVPPSSYIPPLHMQTIYIQTAYINNQGSASFDVALIILWDTSRNTPVRMASATQVSMPVHGQQQPQCST